MDLNQVKSLFTASVFERGMEYYRKGRVTDMQCTKAGPETNVSCTVRGSKRYTVRFTEMAERSSPMLDGITIGTMVQ